MLDRKTSEMLVREELRKVHLALNKLWNKTVNKGLDVDIEMEINMMYEKITMMLNKFEEKYEYTDMFK